MSGYFARMSCRVERVTPSSSAACSRVLPATARATIARAVCCSSGHGEPSAPVRALAGEVPGGRPFTSRLAIGIRNRVYYPVCGDPVDRSILPA